MRKILLFFLIVLMFVINPNKVFSENSALFPDYSWYGDGTEMNFEISDEADLLGFANIVNGKADGISKDSFNNKVVSLTNNLDLTGIVWTPIGSSMYDHSPSESSTKMFEGTFDGLYHTINYNLMMLVKG